MCQARVSHKSAKRDCQARVSQEECQARLFYKSVLHEYSARVSSKSVQQECFTRASVSSKSVPKDCPSEFYKSVPQECRVSLSHTECPRRVSRKSVLQERLLMNAIDHLLFTFLCSVGTLLLRELFEKCIWARGFYQVLNLHAHARAKLEDMHNNTVR